MSFLHSFEVERDKNQLRDKWEQGLLLNTRFTPSEGDMSYLERKGIHTS